MPFSLSWQSSKACRVFRVLLLFLSLATVASAATMAGRVVDPDGAAVAGARVVASSALGTVAEVSSTDSGQFSLDLPDGTYSLTVVATGFHADPIDITVKDGAAPPLTVQLRVSVLSESIVVSAAHVDVPLSRAGDAVTVITASDLAAKQVETVAEALRLVPGLAIVRSGGRGAITSLFPRGGSSNYTLVLVDGVRANAFGGGYDFGHLSVGDIDRIEVVRSPQSALFGSDAIAAVVQIVTRRGGRPRADLLVEGGNQATMRTSAHAAGSHGKWSFGGGGEHRQSDGFTGVAPATGERVTNDDDHVWHGSGSLEWQDPNRADVLVTANVSRDERGYPGPFGTNPIGAFTSVDRVSRGVNDTRQVGARITHPWSARVRQRIDVGFMDFSSDFKSPFGPSSSGSRRTDGRVQEDIVLTPMLGASAGVEFLRERGTSTYVTAANNQQIPIERGVLGTFGEVRYSGHERLFVTGGVRLEHLTRDGVDANPQGFPPRPLFPNQTTNSVNPKLAVSYLLGPGGSPSATRIRASAGSGIRPPDAFEIAFTDNPDLKPEHSQSVDAGIEQQLAGGTYVIGASVFFTHYDDLIITVGRALQGSSRFYSDNISNARARGLELSADARVTRLVTLRANYSFLDSEILSADSANGLAPAPFKVGDALLRRPRHQGSVEALYLGSRVTAFGELTTRSQILDVEPTYGSFGGLFFSPGYSVINIGGSVRIARFAEVFGRVMNVADRAYEETLGYSALGRNGIVGVRIAAHR